MSKFLSFAIYNSYLWIIRKNFIIEKRGAKTSFDPVTLRDLMEEEFEWLPQKGQKKKWKNEKDAEKR